MGKEATAQQTAETSDSPARALEAIGRRIREIRKSRGMTLHALAEACGLSSSMLSLVERGLASPSIGSLVVVGEALGTTMSDFLSANDEQSDRIVTRAADAIIVETAHHVVRRMLKEDRYRGISIAINEYAPKTGSNEDPLQHEGYEYGLVLDGQLTVQVDGVSHILNEGDLISYSSRRSHRIWNHGDRVARTVWFNTTRE
ncbi:cupin domain-containing protein [Bauldia litoralis]|uniref:cupin domain-containing protein n=1 Tax=Bauldia litoralis TaxID=665467 RepID=UPI003263948E